MLGRTATLSPESRTTLVTDIVTEVQQLFLLQIPAYLVSVVIVRVISTLKANIILLWGAGLNLVVNVTLNAALGAWLGWKMILPILLGASIIGAIVGIVMKMSAALREGRYVPFGPFLAGAGLVVLFAGPERVLGWLRWS